MYSYSSQKKMAMLKCASDPSQKRITNYFDLVDKIDVLRKCNDELMKAFNEADEERKSVLGENNQIEFKSFFNQILLNAEQNATKHSQGRRHSKVVKKFAASLFLYAGSMAYNLVIGICQLLCQAFALHRELFIPSTIVYQKVSSNLMNWQHFKVNTMLRMSLPLVKMQLYS